MLPRMIACMAGCVSLLWAQTEIAQTIRTRGPGCSAWNQIQVEFKSTTGNPAGDTALIATWRWFDRLANPASSSFDPAPSFSFTADQAGAPRQIRVGEVEIQGGGAVDWTPDPRRPTPSWRPPDYLLVCLTLEERLPYGTLNVTLEFAGQDRPKPLQNPIRASVQGPPLPGAPAADGRVSGFVRELDFSGVLLSSVKDKNGVRSRRTEASMDLWFAPVLNWRRLSRDRGSGFVTFFTPYAAEVKASNQPITSSTLSANRIAMGPEYELRWYLRNAAGGVSDNALRVILKGKNASDRDFKVNELKFAAEIRPVWGRANRAALTEKHIKGVRNFRYGPGDRIGRTLAPFVGFEAGKPFIRGTPASAIEVFGPFQRGYFGIDASLNLYRRFSAAMTQKLYLRGERETNRWVHYSKYTAEWIFLHSRAQFASSLFVTFEKGRLPPFVSNVNSVNLGVRVQSSDWGWSGRR